MVTGSSLAPNLKNLRIKITLFTVGVVLVMFIFSTFSILQFAKVSLEKPLFRQQLFDTRLNDFRKYEIIRKEEIVNELWFVTVVNFFVLLILIAIFTWIGSYYLIKPIDQSIKSKEEFLEHSSHELRTPLAILHSDLELSLHENTIEGIKDTNTNALAEIKRLQNLSNTLLNDLSDSKTVTSINQLCNDIILKLNKINTNNIQFQVSGDRVEKLYHNKMYNLLFNLLDNSLKYSIPDTLTTVIIDNKSIVISNSIQNTNFKPSTCLSIVSKLATELGYRTEIEIKNNLFIYTINS